MNNILALNPYVVLSRSANWRCKLNLKVFSIFGILMLSSLLFFYIFQINEMVKGSYLVRDYEIKIGNLAKESAVLERANLKSNSLESIELAARLSNFETISSIKYIQISGTSVAVGK